VAEAREKVGKVRGATLQLGRKVGGVLGGLGKASGRCLWHFVNAGEGSRNESSDRPWGPLFTSVPAQGRGATLQLGPAAWGRRA